MGFKMKGWNAPKGSNYSSPMKNHGGPHGLTEDELQEMYNRGYQPSVAEQFGGQESGRWREGATVPSWESAQFQMDDMQVKKRPMQWDLDGKRYNYEEGRNKYIDDGLASGNLKHPEYWYRNIDDEKGDGVPVSVTAGEPYETRFIQSPNIHEDGPQQSYLDKGKPSDLVEGGITFGVDKYGTEKIYDPNRNEYRYFEHEKGYDGKKNKDYKAHYDPAVGKTMQHPEKKFTIGTEGDNPGIWDTDKRGIGGGGHGGMTEQKKIDLAKQGYEGIDSMVGTSYDPQSRRVSSGAKFTDKGHKKGTHRYDIMTAPDTWVSEGPGPGGPVKGGEFAERSRIVGGSGRAESGSQWDRRRDSATGRQNSYDVAMTGGADTFTNNPVRWNKDLGRYENVNQNFNLSHTDAELNRIMPSEKLNLSNVGQHIRGDIWNAPSSDRSGWRDSLFSNRSSVKGTTKDWVRNLDGVLQPSFVERYVSGPNMRKKTQREEGSLQKTVDKTKRNKDNIYTRKIKGGFLGTQKKQVWENGKLTYDFRNKDGKPTTPISLEKKKITKLPTTKTPTTLPKPKKVTSAKTEKSKVTKNVLPTVKVSAKGTKTKLEKKTVTKLPTKTTTKLPKPKTTTSKDTKGSGKEKVKNLFKKSEKTKTTKTKTTKTKTPKQKREKKDGNIFTRTKEKIQSRKANKTKKTKKPKRQKGGGSGGGILSKFRDEILGPKG